MTISNPKFTQLNSFNITSEWLELFYMDKFPYDEIEELPILPGQYRVLESLDESEDKHGRKIKEVFILHSSIDIDEEIGQLDWRDQSPRSRDDDDAEYRAVFLGNKQRDKIVTDNGKFIHIIDNGIALDVISNNEERFAYATITANDIIKGFKVKIDTLSNRVSRQFQEACETGDVEEAKALMLEYGDKINIHYSYDEGFYFACRNGYKDIITYLMFSPDLKEHMTMNNVVHFMEIYKSKKALEILESLILEHGISKSLGIEGFLNNTNDDKSKTILNFFKMREITNAHDALENALPKKSGMESSKIKI